MEPDCERKCEVAPVGNVHFYTHLPPEHNLTFCLPFTWRHQTSQGKMFNTKPVIVGGTPLETGSSWLQPRASESSLFSVMRMEKSSTSTGFQQDSATESATTPPSRLAAATHLRLVARNLFCLLFLRFHPGGHKGMSFNIPLISLGKISSTSMLLQMARIIF